jgi:hypothetical protein
MFNAKGIENVDARRDRFVIKKGDIKEVKNNRVPMGQTGNYFEGFHTSLANEVNFSFANIVPNEKSLSANPIRMNLIGEN